MELALALWILGVYSTYTFGQFVTTIMTFFLEDSECTACTITLRPETWRIMVDHTEVCCGALPQGRHIFPFSSLAVVGFNSYEINTVLTVPRISPRTLLDVIYC